MLSSLSFKAEQKENKAVVSKTKCEKVEIDTEQKFTFPGLF